MNYENLFLPPQDPSITSRSYRELKAELESLLPFAIGRMDQDLKQTFSEALNNLGETIYTRAEGSAADEESKDSEHT